MIYRVNEKETVCWQDGTVRAKGGQLFEGYDSCAGREGRDYAARILFGFRKVISAVEPEPGDTVLVSVPDALWHAQWESAPRKKKAAKKSAKKAAKRATPEADSAS
jgi:hypothetical protein